MQNPQSATLLVAAPRPSAVSHDIYEVLPMFRFRLHSSWPTSLVLLFFISTLPAAAGVVFEVETTDHRGEATAHQMIIEGKSLKMGIHDLRNRKSDAIFRGETREMLVVDHENKSYFLLDEASLNQIAGQVKSAMSEVEKALANLPPEQRALAEKYLDNPAIPGMGDNTPKRPQNEFRKTDERADKNGYPCVRWDVLSNGKKIRELWVTDWNRIDGSKEVRVVLEDLSTFFDEILDSFGTQLGGTGGGLIGSGNNPFENMKELEGFPVVTREFAEDGSLQTETTLRSSKQQRFEPDAFEPPLGYKRQSMGL